ncbi:MAG: hypothetical protein WCA85_25780 [Paraburkholderia sp.]|uniref:hypothetical protein n=1 Tax=Paraburkholderia sp. TaxID=1926495 RepID=UPI003C692A5A
MPRGKQNNPKPGVAFGSLGAADVPVAVGDVDLPRPPMRVLLSDPVPAAADPKPEVVDEPVAAPAPAEKPKTVYAQLDALLQSHLRSNHVDYAVLHPILVSLAGAKFKAFEAMETVKDPATLALLQKIKAL